MTPALVRLFPLLVALFGIARLAIAHEVITLPMPLDKNGFPDFPINGQLYVRDPSREYFLPIRAGSEQRNNLYVGWTVETQYYHWVTGGDRRPILSGTKVQGFRLNLQGKSFKNWFLLHTADHLSWKKVTDRKPPYVYRLDPFQGRVISERPAPDWETWGGELDPIPHPVDPPSCELTAAPAHSELGTPVTLALVAGGDVKTATIDGVSVPVPRGERKLRPEKAGGFRAEGRVTAKDGRTATCNVDYFVEPKPDPGGEKPRCEITVSPSQIRVGESTLVTFTSFGRVTEATLNGAIIDIPTVKTLRKGDRPGKVTLLGAVKGPPGSATCWAEYDVVP